MIEMKTGCLTSALTPWVGACFAFALLAQPARADAGDKRAASVGALLAELLTGGRGKARTTIDGENLRVFKELKPARKAFSSFQNYGAWPRCTYSHVKRSREGQLFTDVLTVSSKAVRDRFLVSIKHAKGISTALLGVDGTTYDYNWIDNQDGSRVTRENVRATAERLLRRDSAKTPANAGTRVVLDPMTVGFPVFLQQAFRPGEVAALAKRMDGSTYAEFVYSGTVTYKGHKGVVLEIVTNRDGKFEGGPILIGYSILRQDNMMPLRAVWQTDRMEMQDLNYCA